MEARPPHYLETDVDINYSDINYFLQLAFVQEAALISNPD
jgi:hypothetical protein